MDELLQRVAEIRGMPASLIQRSAEARAEKEGISVEAVLTDWAGEAPQDSGESTPDSEQPAAETPSSESASGQVPEPATESVAGDPPVKITTDYLVQLAADAKRMPPKLILSSATARAEHGNTSLEAVLTEWAGVTTEELQESASAQPPGDTQPVETEDAKPDAVTEPEVPAVPTPAAAAVAGALTMDELLEKVAEVKGMPAVLAKRSAEARAKKTGETVEGVLAEWAGVDASAIAAAPTEPTPDEPPATTEPEPAAEVDQVDEPSGPEIIEADAPDIDEPAEGDAPLARGGYPRWLAAAFTLIPLLAITYILVAPNGPDCGSAGQLFVDPETGVALNCDGSEFGTNEVDFMADGAGIYNQCVACHSADGSGGAGPAFTGGAVLATFPAGSCSDQIEWVRLGTAGWPDETYGANEQPVGGFGLMPAFGTSLSDEQLASVALYERVQFGGQPLDEAEIDCGLAEEPVEGEAAVEASAP